MKFFNKLIIIATFISLFSLQGMAAESNNAIWVKANDAYSIGEYNNALELYSSIEESGFVSDKLFYNMGNAYYKLGENAKAILYYERSLKIDPNASDVITNLEIAKLSTLDKIDVVPEFILTTFIKNIRDSFSCNIWAYLALFLFIVTLLFLLGFKFASSTKKRKLSFTIACFTLLLSLFSILLSTSLMFKANSEDFAIITAPVSNVKSAPNSTGNNLFILHDGAKVEILEEAGSWCKIELTDGRQGWTLSSDMEVI